VGIALPYPLAVPDQISPIGQQEALPEQGSHEGKQIST
jgi:hypothetical protein